MVSVAGYAAPWRDAGTALAAGVAQLVFCSGWRAGLLVLCALALLSGWMLLGALVGSAIGTVLGRLFARDELSGWRTGLDGFNPAILGIIGSGAFAARSVDLAWILAAMVAVVIVDQLTRPWARRVGFLLLSAPSLLLAMILSLVLARSGSWWWPAVEVSRDSTALLAAALCIVAAMAVEDRRAAGWTLAWSLIGFALTLVLVSSQVGLYVDLWGIAIPLAGFGTFRLFPGSRVVALSMFAATVASALCVGWMQSPLYEFLPPLVMPVVLALWLLVLMQRSPLPLVLNASWWRCAQAVGRAYVGGAPVVVAVGRRSARGLRDEDERIEQIVHDPVALWRLWQRADELRREPAQLGAALAARLAIWLKQGVITHLWVADDTGRYNEVDQEQRVDANGRADLVRCFGCGDTASWPPRTLWQRVEIRCSRCGGAVVPDLAYPAARRDLALVGALKTWPVRGSARGVIIYLGEHGEERLDLARLNGVGAATGMTVLSLPRLVDPAARGDGTRERRLSLILLGGVAAVAFVARRIGAGRPAQQSMQGES